MEKNEGEKRRNSRKGEEGKQKVRERRKGRKEGKAKKEKERNGRKEERRVEREGLGGERQGMKKVIHIADFVVDSRYFRPDLSWGWW